MRQDWVVTIPLVRQWAGHLVVPEIRRFTQDSLFLVTPRVVGFLALTGIAMAFTHFSTPEIHGQFQYVNAILGVMALFALPSMPLAVARGSMRGRHSLYARRLMARRRSRDL